MNNIEPTIMALTMCDHTYTTHVTTSSNHCDYTSIEANEVADLTSRKVDLHSIVDFDGWIGISDSVAASRLLVSSSYFGA